ncbi:MAG: uroporphyrinogen-III C-methyltransferase [Alphaproteobacteria bacterium]|nr:uroporphyrinogen-III C-methyltransferase [Alphaproteobacteria bacterium]
MPKVYLIGAGPGDPDLLTVKAARLLETADAVVYDRLVGDGIMDLVPAGAARIYVGKEAGYHHMAQDEINDLLYRTARPGRTVVRLKGGDPFIFGRGSEEALYLRARGVQVEVVPGITAASGCCSAVGVPLTHRGYATGFRIITGHCGGNLPLDYDWQCLADPKTTLVVYMGASNLPEIAHQLMAHGLPGSTPAVAIASGTLPEQKICRGTLQDLHRRLETADLPSPVLIVIGRVVALMDELAPEELFDFALEHAGHA